MGRKKTNGQKRRRRREVDMERIGEVTGGGGAVTKRMF